MAIYQVVLRHGWLGQAMRNVLHYQTTNPLTAAQQQEASDDVRASINSVGLLAEMDNGWGIGAVAIRRVDVADLPETVVPFTSGSLAGTNSGDLPTASQLAVLCTGHATTTYPRTVRSYWPGLVNTGINQFGEWDSTVLAEVQGLFERLDVLAVTGDSLERVCVQYSGVPPVVTASNRVEFYDANNIPSALRSRRKGVGI